MPSLRLTLALSLSLALHAAGLIGLPERPRAATASAPLQVSLQPAETPERAAERLIKNTLEDGRDSAHPASARPPPSVSGTRAQRAETVQQQARRKLSQQLFYPPAALEQGLQGTVTLRIELGPQGQVLDAVVLAGSGHELLDQAAQHAARAIGRIDAGTRRELLLPVVFRLPD